MNAQQLYEIGEGIKRRLLDTTRKMVHRRQFQFTLNEFYPKNPSLMGINCNRSIIYVRFRSATDSTQFLEWEYILGTFIHELAHMLISEHSAAFYELMDAMYNEIDDDNNTFVHNLRKQTQINTATNTYTKGYRLGGIARPKTASARSKTAAAAAERRLAVPVQLVPVLYNVSTGSIVIDLT
jgi:hypothetical protein